MIIVKELTLGILKWSPIHIGWLLKDNDIKQKNFYKHMFLKFFILFGNIINSHFFSVLCVKNNIRQVTIIFLLTNTNTFSNPFNFSVATLSHNSHHQQSHI